MRWLALALIVVPTLAWAQTPPAPPTSGKEWLVRQVFQLNAAVADLIDENTKLKADIDTLHKQIAAEKHEQAKKPEAKK